MYLQNKDMFEFFKLVLKGTGIEYVTGSGERSPVLTFYFKGKFCWTLATGTGFSNYSEDPEVLKELEASFYSILKEQSEEQDAIPS